MHLNWTFFGSGLRGRKYGWINDRELGGGWIGAYGSHLIDFTRWLFGSEVADCGGRIDAGIDGIAARGDGRGRVLGLVPDGQRLHRRTRHRFRRGRSARRRAPR